jgi:hypothetical protein
MSDSILISNDAGNTWHKERDSLFGRDFGFYFADYKTVYSLFNTTFYKGIYRIQDSLFAFTQINNRTYSCTIKNDNNTSYNATVIVAKNDSVYYQYSIVIVNGTAFTVTLPKDVPSGNGYSIKVIPTDTLQYSTIQSSSFTINKDSTGVGIVNQEQSQNYIVQGNRIIVKGNEEVAIYSLLGQKLYSVSNSEISLPTGFYIIKCNNTIQKVVIIKP